MPLAIRSAKGGREYRSVNLTGGYMWNDALWMTGVVPPNGAYSLGRSGISINEKTVTKATPVNICLRIISNMLLSCGYMQPYSLAYDKQKKPYHQAIAPIPPVLLNPWSDCGYTEGFTKLIYSLALFGEALELVTARDEMGDPLQMEILHPLWMDVKPLSNGQVEYKLIGPGQEAQILPLVMMSLP